MKGKPHPLGGGSARKNKKRPGRRRRKNGYIGLLKTDVMPAPGRPLTLADVAYVKANYTPRSIERLASELGISIPRVSRLVTQLGLKGKPRMWTELEESFLRANYGPMSCQQIAQALGMPLKAVHAKRAALHLPLVPLLWTPERLAYLHREGPNYSYPQLARQMGLPAHVVQRMGTRLKIAGPGPRTWTSDEERFLIDNYATMSGEDIARHLDRPRQAILKRASRLGIHRSPEEFTRLQLTSGSLSDTYVAKHMARKNPALQAELLRYPELLDIRKKEIVLNRTIRHAGKPDNG